jgi:fatty-acyl-CoA synthase
LNSTMQDDYQLTVGALFRHGLQLYPDSEVATFDGTGFRRMSFTEVGSRVARLAKVLRGLGVRPGDRVATLCWNTHQHLEAYLAVPTMGAVLHTLNARISDQQLAYVINHADDRVIIVDAVLVAALRRIKDQLKAVRHIVVVGESEDAFESALDYETLVTSAADDFGWPAVDEKSAAALCYTSGTTGDPKGVAYSHRSIYLHSLAECAAGSFGLRESDRVLPVVPMFHANAWGLLHASWLAGSDLVLPSQFVQPHPLKRLIASEAPTVSAAVPTVWVDLARHLDEHGAIDMSCLRLLICGGSAVPRHLMELYEERYGARIVQAWGMTETSPIAALSHPPKHLGGEREMDWRARTGRVVAGVEVRIVDESGAVLPWDGDAVGEIQVRGPWIASGYHRGVDTAVMDRGWLRTGDVGRVERNGFVRITDRVKDVIKSGGEWISSVDLEAHIMAHPDVAEAAVVAVPDQHWQERPLACVVLRPNAAADIELLSEFLRDRVPRWWIPEQWTFLTQVPRTSVGKFDKKALRALHQSDSLNVEHRHRTNATSPSTIGT